MAKLDEDMQTLWFRRTILCFAATIKWATAVLNSSPPKAQH